MTPAEHLTKLIGEKVSGMEGFDWYALSWEALARDWLRPEEDIWDELLEDDENAKERQ
jgi:hypothetical protein